MQKLLQHSIKQSIDWINTEILSEMETTNRKFRKLEIIFFYYLTEIPCFDNDFLRIERIWCYTNIANADSIFAYLFNELTTPIVCSYFVTAMNAKHVQTHCFVTSSTRSQFVQFSMDYCLFFSRITDFVSPFFYIV